MSPQQVAESTKFDLCNAYKAARGPLTVSIDGQEDDFIVMRASDLEGEFPLTDAEKSNLLAGYDDVVSGHVVDARDMIARMRCTFGL